MARAKVATIQGYRLTKINSLERRIVQAEDEADACLWEQAALVVQQLDEGMSQRELAAAWINARTGKPYSHTHVQVVVKVASLLATENRPPFREAYNALANAPKPHVSQNSGNDEWYTPPPFVEAARQVLGRIDLDPATTPEANAVVKARKTFTAETDGLAQPWKGAVWMNPPYAQPAIGQFCDKLVTHVETGEVTAAVVLVNNATETAWFHTLLSVASAVCFPKGRVQFWAPDKDSASPLQGQALVYVGTDVRGFAEAFGAFGAVLYLR